MAATNESEAAASSRQSESAATPVQDPSSTALAVRKKKQSNGRSTISADEARRKKQLTAAAEQTYGRGQKVRTGAVKDKKLRGNLKVLEGKYKDAVQQAQDAEILLEHTPGLLVPDRDLERTYRVSQREIQDNVGVETAKKGFELKLPDLGPYIAEYTRNGRDLLLAGRKGHVATVDWREGKLQCELQLQETVRDAIWLHNNQYFALAQPRSVYIYDHQGVELHRLAKHIDVTHMQFLPYHYLLATLGQAGYLKYTDTSTGQHVIEMATKLGASTAMTQNPYNAIIHAGHHNGTVTLWSPNSTSPLVKLLAHRGPVRALAIDREGRYMVSGGQDMRMAVWDIRMFKEVNNYFLRRPASSIAISDRGLTSVAWGTQLSVWQGLFNKALPEQRKVQSPYLAWGGEGQLISRTRWCPFEDVLGVGHDGGFSSILVPGAGEPNFDALEANPYETAKQRQEREVSSLLTKLQPGMIALQPNFVGNLNLETNDGAKGGDLYDADKNKSLADGAADKKKARGKNSALKRYLRKKNRVNIIDEKRLRIEEAVKAQEERGEANRQRQAEEFGPALARFAKKGG